MNAYTYLVNTNDSADADIDIDEGTHRIASHHNLTASTPYFFLVKRLVFVYLLWICALFSFPLCLALLAAAPAFPIPSKAMEESDLVGRRERDATMSL